MKRADAFALVTQHGGKPRQGITKDTKVLIVGELGWPLQDDGRPSDEPDHSEILWYSDRQRAPVPGMGRQNPRRRNRPRPIRPPSSPHLSKLPADVVEQLSMFGLIEARDGLYGFRDLAAARQVAQLLGSGIVLSVITRSLRDIRKWLPDARLSNLRLFPESSDKILVEQVQGRTDSKGQFVLPVDQARTIPTPTELSRRRKPPRRPATSARPKSSTGVS